MTPRYAEHEKCMKVARPTITGYCKAKSRKKCRMARCAPVSDSKQTYRGTMQATPLSKYCTITKGDSYSVPSIARIGKIVIERDTEADVGHLADKVKLVDLTEDKETCVLSEGDHLTETQA
ncbi:hypothetical protein GN958_ATG17707 [Phytophthora infestans]|uniref:Uncharacterized protein n=1 Tax=Phytophthora infestans TaxID=4787 RepID=A0A8S9TWG6_PHYIN|nr:hypothetical protein GN958_ATG17707 [Phytophthora infestans]